MTRLGLEQHVVDRKVYERTVQRFREARAALPTFAELRDPARIPQAVWAELAGVDPDAAHPLNLYRVHWWNDDARRGRAALPAHVVLPESFTGVAAPIVVILGQRFPMIHAHKVLAAYACLAPRLVTGQFDPTSQRAVWPSTGNYCRGGVAISRIMGCRGVAVLPEGMSRERFDWLERWVGEPGDVIRTPGTESNVREIYEACEELERDPAHVVFNQFSEFGNHLAHYLCTGDALERVFESLRAADPALRAAAYVSATGSAGTLAAGDALKERHGARIVAVEALECPTMLENGFGEHNIQGIGDKHIPLIHNVMNTDIVVAISDRATDALSVALEAPAGRQYLRTRRAVPEAVLDRLPAFGLSSLCNVLAAVKTAKHLRLGPHDAVLTVATDGAELYASEMDRVRPRDFPHGVDAAAAAEAIGRHLLGAGTDHLLELSSVDRRRIFNLGYFTWVEQRGVSLADFTARREPAFWTGLRELVPAWDAMIAEFNAQTGAAVSAARR
ncbi:MAG: pyridoxal-5'-phosphate-dependent protein subunit beta [Candidatus Eisenbacteria bacterium RBG_16_71_46]|nr:MAG: pyridoxal-5'-phosphate-dependent protein subunit beta [Candidatus Eisenbacteria bacterium RBG_16_71_46]